MGEGGVLYSPISRCQSLSDPVPLTYELYKCFQGTSHPPSKVGQVAQSGLKLYIFFLHMEDQKRLQLVISYLHGGSLERAGVQNFLFLNHLGVGRTPIYISFWKIVSLQGRPCYKNTVLSYFKRIIFSLSCWKHERTFLCVHHSKNLEQLLVVKLTKVQGPTIAASP